jgi:hypothetical protein
VVNTHKAGHEMTLDSSVLISPPSYRCRNVLVTLDTPIHLLSYCALYHLVEADGHVIAELLGLLKQMVQLRPKLGAVYLHVSRCVAYLFQ